ncbi:uncharacterized protein EV420DRAFT_1656992 [Desarmillaria tabescens]|uniref:Uncharacterized protein n=1 Tax=Armillaria tabescens TaxID=1929756 RepID=A0AA39IV96_ARMTA|nr:uncharacterized protein EV420DRAFT_1656992 [Desarmillaria tabescens]KAK0431121.1 hypothetical protein EV420DRAFT_1656992 [Desarmillaria tabescens]
MAPKAFFKSIWSLAKKTAIDTRDDFRSTFINGQGSTVDSLKPSSTFDSEEFSPRGQQEDKAKSTVPINSGRNYASSSGKNKLPGSGTKSTGTKSTDSKSAQKAGSKSIQLPTNTGGSRA